MILPRKIFFVVKDFENLGIGFGGDPVETLDDAIDQALSHYSPERKDFRIFQVDMDPDTNRPERIEDVTEDAMNARPDAFFPEEAA